MDITTVIVVSILIEAVVNAVKPIWSKDKDKRLSVAEIVSIVLGVEIALLLRINLLDEYITTEAPAWSRYVFYALSGVVLGRGPSYLFDVIKAVREWSRKKLTIADIAQALEAEDADPLPPEPESAEKKPYDPLDY